MADILGHATSAVPKDQINSSNPHLKNLYEGLTMTKDSLLQVFKRHGLEVVNPINEKFNPNLHEALFQKVCSLRLEKVRCTKLNSILYRNVKMWSQTL